MCEVNVYSNCKYVVYVAQNTLPSLSNHATYAFALLQKGHQNLFELVATHGNEVAVVQLEHI